MTFDVYSLVSVDTSFVPRLLPTALPMTMVAGYFILCSRSELTKKLHDVQQTTPQCPDHCSLLGFTPMNLLLSVDSCITNHNHLFTILSGVFKMENLNIGISDCY